MMQEYPGLATEFDYRLIVDQSPDAILVTDRAGTIVEANQAACVMLRYSRGDLIGRSQTDFVTSMNPDEAAAGLGLLREGRTLLTERTLPRSDGSRVQVEIGARMLPDGRTQAVVRDITRRKAAEAERDRLASVIEQVGESIVLTDPDGRVIYANPAFTRLHGYEPSEIIGHQIGEVVRSGEHSADFYSEVQATLAAGRQWSGRIVNRRSDSGLVELELTISPRSDHSGAIVGWTEVGRDIGPERALQAQLHQAMKMEAIGRLAGGIAHDFNNLLTGIRGFAELHLAVHPQDDEERADVLEIIQAANRASALVRRLLAFSRHSDNSPKPVDLADLARRAEPFLRQLLGEDIAVVLAVEAVPAVLADPVEIEEILLNLAANSRDAMPGGGIFSLKVLPVELDATFVAGHPGATEGSYVVLVVTDTGSGMDEVTQAHIFEPFFTTKPPGKGTGLGLASAYGIVKRAGGYIEVVSELGKGAAFRAYLPAIAQVVQPMSHATKPECDREGGHERILLVEDEPVVRSFAQLALERHGYSVSAFADPLSALEAVGEDCLGFDGLVSDVVMPQMSGPALAQRFIDRRPAFPVLFISGHGQAGDVTQPGSASHPASQRLSKPFTSCELAESVAALFGHSVPPRV
jgi:two-component system, cell cycle sensor histidine kinase and response regulator CckA